MKVQVLPSRQNIMNSKRIGNIGEAITLAKFVEKGIAVYVPFGDNEKIDLIIELNKQLYKVQVKTSNRLEQGCLIFNTRSSRSGTKETVLYTEEDIDLYACYSLITKELYILERRNFPQSTVSLRVEDSKNNQLKNVKFAKDYTLDKFLTFKRC